MNDCIFSHCDRFTFVKCKKILQRENKSQFRVCSESMHPVMKINDMLEVVPVNLLSPDLIRFDIIVFWDGKKLISHFVWHVHSDPFCKRKRTILTRSIADCLSNDVPVHQEYILGKVDNFIMPWRFKLKIIFFNIFHHSA